MRILLAKLARYATVSAISTSVTLVLLGTLVYTRSLTPGWANVVATAVGTVPSFELNRRWVWAKRGQRSLGREVVPFCSLSFAGLGLSTLAVSLVAHWSRGAGMSDATTALLSQMANVATFGALWVIQFFMLEKLLFRPVPAPRAAAAMVTAASGEAIMGSTGRDATRSAAGQEATVRNRAGASRAA